MSQSDSTNRLLSQVRAGDAAAREQLAERYRARLRRLIQLHLDPRVRARVDPSDVIQETLLAAFRRLPEYLADPKIPFYPWLRQLAWDRLCDLQRRHVAAQRRSVNREWGQLPLPDETSYELASQLFAVGFGPVSEVIRQE